MLTSAGQIVDAARCRQLGASAYLTKPAGQSKLFNSILQAFGAGEAGQPSGAAMLCREVESLA